MVAPGWNYEEARQRFFIYLEREGDADLLHELRTTPITSNIEVQRLVSALYRSLKATAHATTAPFFTALLGGGEGRVSTIMELLQHAATTRNRDVLASAVTLLQNSEQGIVNQPLRTLQTLHQRNVMPEAFQALLRQGTAMAWGAFEAFCFDLFRLLFTTRLDLLRSVAADATSKKNRVPWSDNPKRLLRWIEEQTAANPSLTNQDAFDTFKLPSMQIGATRHFNTVLFPMNGALLTVLSSPELSRLSARRHIILHAAGIVDAKYVADSGEALALESELVVTPRELALGFRAVSAVAFELAVTAGNALGPSPP